MNTRNLVPKKQLLNLTFSPAQDYGTFGTQLMSIFHEKPLGRFFAILDPGATYLFIFLSLIPFAYLAELGQGRLSFNS